MTPKSITKQKCRVKIDIGAATPDGLIEGLDRLVENLRTCGVRTVFSTGDMYIANWTVHDLSKMDEVKPSESVEAD